MDGGRMLKNEMLTNNERSRKKRREGNYETRKEFMSKFKSEMERICQFLKLCQKIEWNVEKIKNVQLLKKKKQFHFQNGKKILQKYSKYFYLNKKKKFKLLT